MTTTPFIVEVEAKAVDLFCLFFRMGIQRKGGAFPNLKYSLKRRWGEGEKQNGREKVSKREWGREGERERERKWRWWRGTFHAGWLKEAERKQNSIRWNEVKIIQALIKPGRKEGVLFPVSRRKRTQRCEWRTRESKRDNYRSLTNHVGVQQQRGAYGRSGQSIVFAFYRKQILIFRSFPARGKFEICERGSASALTVASKRQLYGAARTTVQGPERTELIKTLHCLQCLIFRPSFRGPVTTQ